MVKNLPWLQKLAIGLLFLIGARTGSAMSLSDWIKCIGPNGQGPVCQLDPGTYTLNQQMLIGRSNISIKGTIATSRRDTTVQRATGFHGSILVDSYPPFTAFVTGITIRDLTFDGNRLQNTDVWSSY